MLPRQRKLTKKADIERLARTGKRHQSLFFIIKQLPNNLSISRWVIVVSGKVHKQAVKRNRLRRQIREIIRTNLLNEFGGKDTMVIAKDTSLDKEFSDLKADLFKLLNVND